MHRISPLQTTEPDHNHSEHFHWDEVHSQVETWHQDLHHSETFHNVCTVAPIFPSYLCTQRKCMNLFTRRVCECTVVCVQSKCCSVKTVRNADRQRLEANIKTEGERVADKYGRQKKDGKTEGREKEKEDLVSPLAARRQRGGGAAWQAANRAGERERGRGGRGHLLNEFGFQRWGVYSTAAPVMCVPVCVCRHMCLYVHILI